MDATSIAMLSKIYENGTLQAFKGVQHYKAAQTPCPPDSPA